MLAEKVESYHVVVVVIHSTGQRFKCVIFGSKCALRLIIIVDRVIDQTRDLLSQIFEGSIWAYQ